MHKYLLLFIAFASLFATFAITGAAGVWSFFNTLRACADAVCSAKARKNMTGTAWVMGVLSLITLILWMVFLVLWIKSAASTPDLTAPTQVVLSTAAPTTPLLANSIPSTSPASVPSPSLSTSSVSASSVAPTTPIPADSIPSTSPASVLSPSLSTSSAKVPWPSLFVPKVLWPSPQSPTSTLQPTISIAPQPSAPADISSIPTSATQTPSTLNYSPELTPADQAIMVANGLNPADWGNYVTALRTGLINHVVPTQQSLNKNISITSKAVPSTAKPSQNFYCKTPYAPDVTDFQTMFASCGLATSPINTTYPTSYIDPLVCAAACVNKS